MSLPKIDASALPDLPDATGVFGSHAGSATEMSRDYVVFILMCYLAEVITG